jgi:uncharacterized membrane protein YidH (DUF202 family)
MRITFCLLGVFFISIFPIITVKGATFPIEPPKKAISLHQFTTLKIKDAQLLAGRKFSLKEKLGFKLLQLKLKKETKLPGKTKSSKKGKASFWLGLFSLLTMLIPYVSIPLAIMAIILGNKALKQSGGDDRKAKAGTTMAVLSIGIIVVAALIFVVFISDGAFGIFVY